MVGPSFPQLATYLSYLAQQKVDFPFSLEEAYYSWSCPMDSSSCSFSLLNMIQYTLYSVLFQTNRQNTIHRPLPLRLPLHRTSSLGIVADDPSVLSIISDLRQLVVD